MTRPLLLACTRTPKSGVTSEGQLGPSRRRGIVSVLAATREYTGQERWKILLVPIGIGVLRDFTPEQPIDNAEIQEREHNAEDPPGQADAKGVRPGDRAGYRDALATRTC